MANASGSADFALRLTQQCYQNGQNLCLSPYSARIALSMALNGARGETLRQMKKVLGYGSSSIEQINQSNITTHRMISTGLSYKELMVANSLWLNEGHRPNPDYVRRVTSKYGALVKSLDFNNPRSVKAVNRWISEVTNGRVDQMNTIFNPLTECIIINTAFFHKEWMYPFNPRDNTRAAWYGSSNQRSQITYMNQSEHFYYLHNNSYDVVSLPYLLSGISMLFILPCAGSTPLNVLLKLDGKSLAAMVKGMRSQEVHLTLPKFKLKSNLELIRALIGMGMKIPFGNHADFSALCESANDGSFIGEFKQNCSIEVNEKGTVAAAATEGMPYGSVPVRLTFNRPFVFMIRHGGSGELLFTGVVNKPQA